MIVPWARYASTPAHSRCNILNVSILAKRPTHVVAQCVQCIKLPMVTDDSDSPAMQLLALL